MAALKESPSSSLQELKITVESYAESSTRYEIQKCVKMLETEPEPVPASSDLEVTLKCS